MIILNMHVYYNLFYMYYYETVVPVDGQQIGERLTHANMETLMTTCDDNHNSHHNLLLIF